MGCSVEPIKLEIGYEIELQIKESSYLSMFNFENMSRGIRIYILQRTQTTDTQQEAKSCFQTNNKI